MPPHVLVLRVLRAPSPYLSISNTGPGVPRKDVDQLFQPLRRLANRVGDGLGLGLSIVQAIADAHLATITTQPRPDGGLSIEVGFPNARSGVAVSDPMSRGPCHNGPTIVVYGPTAG